MDDTMRLMELPTEVIHVIKNHYLNEEQARNPTSGELETDANGEFVPNEQRDPRSKQGLPIVWKLVCKSTQATLPCNVESPLIAGCGSVDMLEWIRRDWNGGYDDSRKNAKLLALIIDDNNNTLYHSLVASPPEWLINNYENIGEAAVEGALHNVLEFLCFLSRSTFSLWAMVVFAISKGNNGIPTIKWIVEKCKRCYDWDDDRLHSVFSYAIKYKDCPDVVEAVHETRDLCSYESDENTYAYANINFAMMEDEDDPDVATPSNGKLVWVQQLVNAGPGVWNYANYGNEGNRIYHGRIYKDVCPLAAKHGHLDTLKRLYSLGYELNKNVMMEAVIAGHCQDGGVASWADSHIRAQCTVQDMISAGHWSLERERERDDHIEQHMGMSAYQHLVCHKWERVEKDRQETARASDEARAADTAMFLRQRARAYENKRRRDEEIETNR